jgi:octanoyl-[GcvH]:protein N-octanoyltransferase
MTHMLLLRGGLPDDDPAVELAVAGALVRRASQGDIEETLRVYRPSKPVVVFGRRDTRAAGFGEAASRARAAGFVPLVRMAGGRAVAYTGATLVVDHIGRERDPAAGMEARFLRFGELYAEALRGLGVDARVGAVPGEYCPGAQSVNARGVAKLVGTAQRIVRNAWLFSVLVVVADEDRLRPLLREVYRCLGEPLDDESVGSVSGEVPGLDVETVERTLLDSYASLGSLEPTPPDAATYSLALRLAADHRSSSWPHGPRG